MVVSINIDETVLRPNVRPAKPKSKRGPVTFFVDIEEPNGRSVKRNLTRGVNDLDDDFTPTPQPPVDVSLQTLLLSLSLSSTFTTNNTITFEPIDIGLSLPTLETKVRTSLDIITVDLTVPALNTDIATNFEALGLSMSLPTAEIASDIYGELVVVNLSVAGTLDTGININLPASMESAQDDDVATIGSPSLLLDTYSGAAAAYSLRKLSTSYTGSCLKVRRDDGVDTGTDIGFDVDGNLNTAAIAAHCGTDNGYVVTWYDQSGNSRDATQTASADQPKIYDGSAIITQNGKPSIQFDGSSDYMDMPDSMLPANINNCSVFTVQKNESSPNGATFNIGGYGSNDRWFQTIVVSNVEYFGYGSNYAAINMGSATTAQRLITAIAGSTQGNAQCFVDGTSQGSVALASATPTSGSGELVRSSYLASGTFQEVIVYHSDQSTNRTDIEADISAYWQSNRRTLDAYPGAAAAYSVRKLDNDYTGSALRVREDSGNTETNIGFDSNGDLDTAAIASHCGSANGYVVTWYDQSGNGEDVTQSTTTSQPQIYNGTATITNNGKPALLFATDNLNNTTISATRPNTTFAVTRIDNSSGNVSIVFDGNTSSGRHNLYTTNANPSRWEAYGGGNLQGPYATSNADYLTYTLWSTGTSELALNGAAATTGSTGSQNLSGLNVGARYNNVSHGNGYYHEIVVFDSDESSNRTGIESDINTYYSVYP